jgi:DNA-binding NtrC family response regulator
MAHILVIEDNTTMREGIVQILKKLGHEVYGANSGREGLEYFHASGPEFVITDLKMEDMDGMQVLQSIKQQAPQTTVMMITAFGTIEIAVEAMKHGAFDFIAKPFPPDLLRVKVQKALELAQAKAENAYLRDEQMKKIQKTVFGQSPWMKKMQDQMEKVAQTDAHIMITGERGTGKDIFARTLHQASYRKNKAFIKIDCSAFTEEELQVELFGLAVSATTKQRKLGKIELAQNGTLFLDEILSLPQTIQQKLHRMLLDRSFERVGSDKKIAIDVRIIGASQPNIQEHLNKDLFREDLYYAISSALFHLPPLRDRAKDVPDMVHFYLNKYKKKFGREVTLTQDALLALQMYPWPGNIRELETMMERLVALGKEVIEPDDIPLKSNVESIPTYTKNKMLPLHEAIKHFEKMYVLETLQKHRGSAAAAAKFLGLKIKELESKLKELGIDAL